MDRWTRDASASSTRPVVDTAVETVSCLFVLTVTAIDNVSLSSDNNASSFPADSFARFVHLRKPQEVKLTIRKITGNRCCRKRNGGFWTRLCLNLPANRSKNTATRVEKMSTGTNGEGRVKPEFLVNLEKTVTRCMLRQRKCTKMNVYRVRECSNGLKKKTKRPKMNVARPHRKRLENRWIDRRTKSSKR